MYSTTLYAEFPVKRVCILEFAIRSCQRKRFLCLPDIVIIYKLEHNRVEIFEKTIFQIKYEFPGKIMRTKMQKALCFYNQDWIKYYFIGSVL